LDALLAETFQQLGGELRSNARWAGTGTEEGLVQASGRRLQSAEHLPRWFGVKAHLPCGNNVQLEADLEMHISPDGYVGVNRINNGEVNVCGLFRTRETRPRPASKQDWLRGETGSSLRERLNGAEFDSASFCSVAGLPLQPQRGEDKQACSVGDALTMTPPVTGNGMSMAFESAEMAVEPLANYSEGRYNWTEARTEIARRCDARFAPRLAWARRLQWLMMSPVPSGPFGGWLLHSDTLWRLMFARTR
jgi:flavin-dependent dehydrogenase